MSAAGFAQDPPLTPADRHTPDNAVPPLGYQIETALNGLANIHPGIDQIVSGFRLLGTDRLTLDMTQTLLTAFDGSGTCSDVATLIALAVQRLTNPDSNPALRALPHAEQKAIRREGELYAHAAADAAAPQYASEAAGLIYETNNHPDN